MVDREHLRTVCGKTPGTRRCSRTGGSGTRPRENFRITDDALGVGGPKNQVPQECGGNRTLKQIGTRAAPPPRRTGNPLPICRLGRPAQTHRRTRGMGGGYAELKGLLAPDEYTSARASTHDRPLHQPPPSSRPFMRRWGTWAFGKAICWSRPAAWGTSLAFCRRTWGKVKCTAWSWTVSAERIAQASSIPGQHHHSEL